jgi:hypothetical protein
MATKAATEALDAAKAFITHETMHARIGSDDGVIIAYSRGMYDRALPILEALNQAYIGTENKLVQKMFERVYTYAINYGMYACQAMYDQKFAEATEPRQAFATRVSLMVLESGIQLG